MRLVLAAPPPDTASLARTGNSGVDAEGIRRSTHRGSTAMVCSTTAAASINARNPRAPNQPPHPPRSNPHSARRHRCAFPQRGFGVPERHTRLLREAFILAAEAAGGGGPDGLVKYLTA